MNKAIPIAQLDYIANPLGLGKSRTKGGLLMPFKKIFFQTDALPYERVDE